jgi:hypothetical protein
VTPELRARQDELHERLAVPINHHQSPEDTQRDWTDIRRAYAHHVQRANAWDLPFLPAVQLQHRVAIAVQTELAAGVRQTFETLQADAQRALEALAQANLAHHVGQAMAPDHGLTVIDETHITTDEQLARFTSPAPDGPVAYEYVSPAVVNDRPAGWLRRWWSR